MEKTMTTIIKDEPVAQGDIMICRVDQLPDGYEKQTPVDDKFVIAHSETGHHHAVRAQDGVAFYESASNDNASRLVAYLVVNNPKEKCLVEHERSFDTHGPYQFDDGVYIIRRQIESEGPNGWRRAAD